MPMNKINNRIHSFHLVDPSPWPLLGALGALSATCGSIMWFNFFFGGGFLLTCGLSIIILIMTIWWRDIIRENSFEGNQTSKVEKGMCMGMLLFITSEIMFFVAFFWAFFYSSINPDLSIGGIWPPLEIEVLDSWEVPLLNTLILLSSGATVTVCHNCLITNDQFGAEVSIEVTCWLAFVFLGLQHFEYMCSSFNISDGVYGSCFYMATGFHGFHVFIGYCFLNVCSYRIILGQFSRENHFSFEAAAWYWHFVDVVWLFLFVAVYWWGGV
jgi:cytochrome c oxidase subunit 3